jgi:hypothetical protein
MALDLSSLGNLTTQLGGLMPSGSSLLQNLALGAGTTVLISGLQSGQGQDAIDPLHWFHHPNSGAMGLVQGNVMTMSAYKALSPDGQKTIDTMHYTIIPG